MTQQQAHNQTMLYRCYAIQEYEVFQQYVLQMNVEGERGKIIEEITV